MAVADKSIGALPGAGSVQTLMLAPPTPPPPPCPPPPPVPPPSPPPPAGEVGVGVGSPPPPSHEGVETVADALLLPVFGSSVWVMALTVLVKRCIAGKPVVDPNHQCERFGLPRPDFEKVPRYGVSADGSPSDAETNVVLAGSVSVTTTYFAQRLPSFLTVIVYVTVSPVVPWFCPQPLLPSNPAAGR